MCTRGIMWNNTQIGLNNMGLQIQSSNGCKRSREDYCNQDENSIPRKIGKTEEIWEEEYYPAGKCYQCHVTTSEEDNNVFYGSISNSNNSCEQYNNSSQCWVAANNNSCNNVNNHNSVNNNAVVSHNDVSSSTSTINNNNCQQTIKCDENGKSYLDLGSGTTISNNTKCNLKSRWCTCGPACYRQTRLTVLNISMFKLGRYRQFTDPSLCKSVLICNTLRYIEREMEQDGCFPLQSSQPLVGLEPPPELIPRAATPFPQSSLLEDDTDSGLGDDNKSINWGSVLSLSSQSDLDPLNNNDSLTEIDLSQDLDDILPSCKLTPLSVDDILKNVPSSQLQYSSRCGDSATDIDNIMQVIKFNT